MRFSAITVLAALLAACSDPVAPPVPAELTVLHGPGAVSVPGQRFDTVSIRLTAGDGTPIVGWPVTWSGDGTVEPYDSVTDVVGIARARWTLPRYDNLSFGAVNGPSGSYALRADAVGFDGRRMTTDAHAFTADTVVASRNFGCGLRGGRLWCWGPWSVFGRGARQPVDVPLPAVPAVLVPGYSVLCMLDTTASAWCRSAEVDEPWHRITNAPPLLDLTTIEPAWSGGTVCGRGDPDQRIWCWSQRGSATATVTALSDRPFAMIDGGYHFGCGIDLEGAAWCWGDNGYGQLGVGDTRPHDGMVPVSGGHRFERISAGLDLACGSDLDHRVWCWGHTGSVSDSPEPMLIDFPWAVGPEIAVGESFDLYVLRNGRIHASAWGAELTFVAEGLTPYRVRTMPAVGPWCVQAISDEVFCSLDLLVGVTDISYPFQLVPVPDPASSP